MARLALQAIAKHVQTDLAARDIECLCQQCLGTQVLSKKLKYFVFDLDSAVSNETRLSFYTGLTGHIADALAELVCPYLMQKGSLEPFQQLILTVMKLRLGLSQTDLGYRFQIRQSVVSRIFCHNIDIMFERVQWLVKWPERDTVKKTMPMAFQKHCPKCTVIIDCFEVFIE